MNRTILIALILYLSVFNAFAQGRDDGNDRARQKVRGTTIKMTPPEKFVQSEDFSGFVDEASGVSIIVFEKLDVACSIYAKNLDEAYFESEGLKLQRTEVIESGSRKEYLYECTTVVEGISMYRLFFLTGDASHTIISVTNVVAEVYDEMYPKIYKSLLSIQDEK